MWTLSSVTRTFALLINLHIFDFRQKNVHVKWVKCKEWGALDKVDEHVDLSQTSLFSHFSWVMLIGKGTCLWCYLKCAQFDTVVSRSFKKRRIIFFGKLVILEAAGIYNGKGLDLGAESPRIKLNWGSSRAVGFKMPHPVQRPNEQSLNETGYQLEDVNRMWKIMKIVENVVDFGG